MAGAHSHAGLEVLSLIEGEPGKSASATETGPLLPTPSARWVTREPAGGTSRAMAPRRNVRERRPGNAPCHQGIRIVDLSSVMHTLYGIQISTYPEGCWRSYLQARPLLYELDPPGSDAKVRYKPKGFERPELAG